MPPQNMPLEQKNYFELKAFEFLKSLIFLKAESFKRLQLLLINPFHEDNSN